MRWDVSRFQKFTSTAFEQIRRPVLTSRFFKSGTGVTRDLLTRGVGAATAAGRSVAGTSTAQRAADFGVTFGRNVYGFGSRVMPTAQQAATAGMTASRNVFGFGAKRVGGIPVLSGRRLGRAGEIGVAAGRGALGVGAGVFDWAGRHPYAATVAGLSAFGAVGAVGGMVSVAQNAAPPQAIGPSRTMSTGAGYNTWGTGSRERTQSNMGASGDLTLALGRMRHG